MKSSPSKDYHDYVFKDGKFIGAFEEMYLNVDDPWHHGDATAIHYDSALLLLKRYTNLRGGVLDIGCGKGAFTARLKESFPGVSVTGVDIALEIIYLVIKEYQSLTDKVGRDFGLVVMFDLMWYVLPEFENIVKYLGRIISKGGWLLISQSFYQPDEQKYGGDIVSSPEDMLKLIPYRAVEIIEVNRFSNHHAIILFQI